MKIIGQALLILLLISCKKGSEQSEYLLDNSRLSTFIAELSSAEWEKVFKAKDSLEVAEAEALPYLLTLLQQENKHIKLINTADLIYPGATEYYGHGWVVDYDIDWLAVRAGWAIEEITFENFGFKENKITEENLFEMEKDTAKYNLYLKTGKYDFKITADNKKKLKQIIEKTQSWWAKNHKSWTRLKGIQQALESNDVQRQSNALQYLRYGNFCIKGLTRAYYLENIEPRIKELANSKEEFIRTDVELILKEANYTGDEYFSRLVHECWKK